MSNSKDPAFLFYPGDWIGGTMGMTFEEKGAYMELLVMQFHRGHMGGHMIGQVVGQIWDKISHKFVQDEDGNWYNERLDQEKERRKAFTDSRKNNLKGKNQYSSKRGHMDGHMTSHMENENENINKDNIEGGAGGRFQKPSKGEILAYLEENFCDSLERRMIEKIPHEFIDYYESVNWMIGKKKMARWKNAVNRWARKRVEESEEKNNNGKIGRNTKADLREALRTDNF